MHFLSVAARGGTELKTLFLCRSYHNCFKLGARTLFGLSDRSRCLGDFLFLPGKTTSEIHSGVQVALPRPRFEHGRGGDVMAGRGNDSGELLIAA